MLWCVVIYEATRKSVISICHETGDVVRKQVTLQDFMFDCNSMLGNMLTRDFIREIFALDSVTNWICLCLIALSIHPILNMDFQSIHFWHSVQSASFHTVLHPNRMVSFDILTPTKHQHEPFFWRHCDCLTLGTFPRTSVRWNYIMQIETVQTFTIRSLMFWVMYYLPHKKYSRIEDELPSVCCSACLQEEFV